MGKHVHTVKEFDKELASLESAIMHMGGLSESMLSDALEAISQHDRAQAKEIITTDRRLNELEQKINEQVLHVLALRQPMANDLRITVAALRVSVDIERIGDIAKNIAKTVRRLPPIAGLEPDVIDGVRRLGLLALSHLKEVLDAFSRRDVALARDIWMRDTDIDTLYNSVFRELLERMHAQRDIMDPCTLLLFVAKNLERVGDHCSNIAESIHFLVHGGSPAEAQWGQERVMIRPEARPETSVLVVEDEEALGMLLRYNLERQGHTVDWVSDGVRALEAVERFSPDVVILDWMLPRLSGLEVCRALRGCEHGAPHIIMLTARGAEEDRVRALDQGADDYVAKPFSMGELLARVRAAVRRRSVGDEAFEVGDMTIYPAQRRLYRGGTLVEISDKQFRILSFMARRPRHVFSRECLLETFWGSQGELDLRVVDACMSRLRRALQCQGRKDPLRTVRSVGYALEPC